MPPELSLWDSLPPAFKAKLDIYDILLHKWQAKINLVGASSLKEAQTRHFEDSLQLLPYIPATAKTLYDLGSGAGFPGLVLAIARPDLSVHLIESDQKKNAFLQAVSRETETPVTFHAQRIEDTDLPPPDVITARALAPLSQLLALTKKWWAEKPDGVLIFPKGETVDVELYDARTRYNFEVTLYPSKTDARARVLCLTGVADKCE